MKDEPPPDARATELLQRWSDGDEEALADLAPFVFDDLRQIARRHLRWEGQGHTLRTTALVNEVFLKLLGKDTVAFDSRRHFYGAVSNLMRRILVDHARRRNTRKRGSGQRPSSLDAALERAVEKDLDLLKLSDALQDLERLDPEGYEIVHLRFFVGMNYREVAEVMKTSVATVRRSWATSLAWLRTQLETKGGHRKR